MTGLGTFIQPLAADLKLDSLTQNPSSGTFSRINFVFVDVMFGG